MKNIHLLYLKKHWQTYCWAVTKTAIAWISVTLTSLMTIRNIAQLSMADSIVSVIDFFFSVSWFLPVTLSLITIAVCIVRFPSIRATYKDTKTDIRVVIECCDLLRQDGLRVIHAVDTFDTDIEHIITPRSLHGAFLTRCRKQNIDIDRLINETLSNVSTQTNTDLPGKQQVYPLGTICPLTIGKDHYVLTAFSHMQPSGSIAITRHEYTEFLRNLWMNLAQPTVRQDVVNVAVMGNQFIDLPAEYTTEQKIDIIVQTFFACARQKACCRTLRICVHDNDALNVDFQHYRTVLEHLAKRPVMDM